MRKRLLYLIGEVWGRGWFLGFKNLVKIVVWDSNRNLSFAVWNPEFRICSPTSLYPELGFKSLYLNPTAHAQELRASLSVDRWTRGSLDATFS
jgi:hypothetical protein